ncbi:MAG: hypothetical protein ACFFCS_26290 [Candidatus Hodarchaeota archaeon]
MFLFIVLSVVSCHFCQHACSSAGKRERDEIHDDMKRRTLCIYYLLPNQAFYESLGREDHGISSRPPALAS